jgi:hypothetical protein
MCHALVATACTDNEPSFLALHPYPRLRALLKQILAADSFEKLANPHQMPFLPLAIWLHEASQPKSHFMCN